MDFLGLTQWVLVHDSVSKYPVSKYSFLGREYPHRSYILVPTTTTTTICPPTSFQDPLFVVSINSARISLVPKIRISCRWRRKKDFTLEVLIFFLILVSVAVEQVSLGTRWKYAFVPVPKLLLNYMNTWQAATRRPSLVSYFQVLWSHCRK